MGIKLSKVAKAAKKYDHILIIMRHAKAEPFGDKGDSERELTDKGLKQAKAVGKGIESLGLVPDQISCSSVTRTRQTLDRMLKTFGDCVDQRPMARLRRLRRRTTRPAEFGTFARIHRDHGIEQTVRRMAGAQRRTARGHQCERLRLKRI